MRQTVAPTRLREISISRMTNALEPGNITGKKVVNYPSTQLNDALIASCRAGNEAPALNRNGELETMLNLGLKAIDTPFTEPFCALGTSKCSYTTISRSPDNAPYPKTLVGYSCTVG